MSIADRVEFHKLSDLVRALEQRLDELEKRLLAELLRRSRTEPSSGKR